MASLSSLEMAQAIVDNNNIEITKKFLGMVTNVVYKPTGSKVKMDVKCYSPEAEHNVVALLTAKGGNVAETANRLGDKVTACAVSSCRLESCVSADHQFAAYQLFRYVNLGLQPLTDMVVFEGENAKIISDIL